MAKDNPHSVKLETGLRQKVLARTVAVNEMSIVHWERYRTVLMRKGEKLRELCAVLDLDFEGLGNWYPWSGSLYPPV